MNVAQTIAERRSIRGFKPDPVPQELLMSILESARHSASNCNTQPWHLSIVSGDAKDRLAESLVAEVSKGNPDNGAFVNGMRGLTGTYKERQYECAACLYGTMDIERGDKEKRNALMLKNWEFFGAPHVGFISMPLTMGPTNAIDIGIYLQSLMLLFTENGLASCPQGALAMYPDPINEVAQIPEGNGVICGISFGYADETAQINQTKTPRDTIENTVTFIS